ncbi:MAG TPA: glycoside hydrolase family 3 N-terminal domain-containing protein [Pyrinomonadaceae bacterium]|nr:glycoside hydrolase family 3 N-terminal domain-containing protein [Pyrinomonadaceae bacterium]
MKQIDPDELSLDEKAGQLFFIGLPGDTLDSSSKALIDEIKPGGICLFARNIRTTFQTSELLTDIRGRLSVEPFLSIDQEGGLVDRLRRILAPMPAASRFATANEAEEHADIIADALLRLGFNMDFAPVVDVVGPGREQFVNGIHSRAFGNSPDTVVEIAGRFLDRLQSRGVVGCLKHFPGLGASTVDSHEDLPVVEIGPDEFRSVDLYPYQRLISQGSVEVVMVAHAAYTALSLQERAQNGKLLPASLSFNFVTSLLRHELGFNGLVITDDLEMGAIMNNFGIGEAAVLALLAGNDMVCICADIDRMRDAHRSVIDALSIGRITTSRLNETLSRILKLKATLHTPTASEPASFDALVDRITDLSRRLA